MITEDRLLLSKYKDMSLAQAMALLEEEGENLDQIIAVDLDLQVYEPGNCYELPLVLSGGVVSDGHLVVGPHSITLKVRQEDWNKFRDWAGDNQRVVKITGYQIKGI